MKVSVLVATYNHEKYIAQALDSVLMQKTNFDYEMLIGEDCSTDSTRKIVREYAARNPSRIRLLLHPSNVGATANLTRLLAESRGEFINILEGDDYWTCSGKLQKQVEFLDQHRNCALCFHNALRIYEDENRVSLPYNSADQKPISTLEDLWQYDFIATCTAMFRKSSLPRLPDWYFALPLGGDWALWMLCAEHGGIGYIDQIMAVYRIHSEGRWNKLDNIGRLEALIAFYERMNSNLGLRYDDIVQPLISKRKAELSLARRTNQLLTESLPPNSTVVVMSRPDEELPRFPTLQVWPFPTRTPRDTRQVLASGATGSVEAPWIGGKGTYRFKLFQAGKEGQLLASVAVSQNSDSRSNSNCDKEVIDSDAYISATPNPVPKVCGLGKTVITWSTGDGSPGVVEVVIEDQPVYYPRSSAAAIEEMEQLRSKGAQFLLAPASARGLFQRYPELEQHIERNYRLVAAESDVGSIYGLR
jgi:glycosyltransferase involved in cell wall biosynthesis